MNTAGLDIPDVFRAAVLVELGKPLEIVEVKSPGHIEPGQVFVRVIKSGACASQIHEIDGRKGPDPYLPHMLGHEGVAEVIRVGIGVSKVTTGDFVVLHWREGSGIQAQPAKYDSSIGTVNAGLVTTFGEYAIVSENRVTRLPRGVPFEFAPLFGCALTTGFGSVVHELKVTPGESAVIIGFGGVGISILKALKLVSAYPIAVVDVDQRKADLALSLGADFAEVVDPMELEIKDRIAARLGELPDVVFEVTGHRHLIEQSYEMTNNSGRTLLVGVPQASDPAKFATLSLHLGKQLLGSHGGSTTPDRDIPQIAKLVESDHITLDDIPLVVFPFEQVNDALDTLRAGTLGRVLIDMVARDGKRLSE